MSFWDLSDGEAANENASKEYQMPGGNMAPIPADSDVLAGIHTAEWGKLRETGEEYVNIRWDVEAPEAYAKRVVFQKLWVDDLDPNAKSEDKALAKRDKHRRMLAAIDANANGRLVKSNGRPSDDDLALALVGAKMVIKLMVWDIGGNTGNWVAAVKGKGSDLSIGKEAPKPAGGGSNGGGFASGDLDDEIPF